MATKAILQMHSVREYMHLDPMRALEKCAEAGYANLELPEQLKTDAPGVWYGHDAKEWRSAAEALDVAIVGGYCDLAEEKLEESVGFFAELGAKHVVMPVNYYPDAERLKRNCDYFNRVGELCARNGLEFWYENHYHEFQILDGRTIFDWIAEGTEPEYVSFALNHYWLMRGLVQPCEVFDAYRDRIRALVIQDYPLAEVDKFNMWHFDRYHPIAKNIQFGKLLQGGEIRNIHPVQCELFCEIGDGMLPLEPIIKRGTDSGKVSCVILKQDYTRMQSEFDSVRRSYLNAQRFEGLDWTKW